MEVTEDRNQPRVLCIRHQIWAVNSARLLNRERKQRAQRVTCNDGVGGPLLSLGITRCQLALPMRVKPDEKDVANGDACLESRGDEERDTRKAARGKQGSDKKGQSEKWCNEDPEHSKGGPGNGWRVRVGPARRKESDERPDSGGRHNYCNDGKHPPEWAIWP